MLKTTRIKQSGTLETFTTYGPFYILFYVHSTFSILSQK